MPYLDAEPLPLPFNGRRQTTRRTSQAGARAAIVKAGSQASRMLVAYAEHGFLSDTDMALRLGLPEGRISARRAGLMLKGFVVFADVVQGRHGAPTCRWRATVSGHRMAEKGQA